METVSRKQYIQDKVIIISKLIDLTGQTFGRLTVIERALNDNQGRARWLCECSCKERNRVIVSGYNLKNKKNLTNSCGCLNKESIYQSLKKYNKYDLLGEYGTGWTSNTNEEFYFDLEDYNKIKDYCWRESNDGYIVTLDNLLMHRLILGVLDKPNIDIDHIEHNTKDNRKSKIRLVDTTHNMMNKSLMSNNKTSKIAGVTWDNQKNKWHSYISTYGKRIELGYYKDINEAIKIRKQAEDKYFGEYSYDKSMNIR